MEAQIGSLHYTVLMFRESIALLGKGQQKSGHAPTCHPSTTERQQNDEGFEIIIYPPLTLLM